MTNLVDYLGWSLLITALVLAGVMIVLAIRSRRILHEGKAAPPPAVSSLSREILRLARVLLVLLIGVVVFLAGMVMLVTPGPGLLVMLVGLAILGTEFIWARRLLVRLRDTAAAMGQRIGITTRQPPPANRPVKRFFYNLGEKFRSLSQRIGLTPICHRIAKSFNLDKTVVIASTPGTNPETNSGTNPETNPKVTPEIPPEKTSATKSSPHLKP